MTDMGPEHYWILSDLENVCDAVLKGALKLFSYLLIIIPCLGLLVLPFVLLVSEGFWALIAPEMLARGLTDLGDSWHGLIAWALRVPGVAIAPLTVVVPWLVILVLQNTHHRSPVPQVRAAHGPARGGGFATQGARSEEPHAVDDCLGDVPEGYARDHRGQGVSPQVCLF